MTFASALVALEVLLGVVVLLPTTYLAVLALASVRARRTSTARSTTRLAFLIAAHDEEAALPLTLAALRGVIGQDDAIVHVVADNCHDRTAEVARAAGACVHERREIARPGKAAALNSLTAEVLAEDRSSEAFAIIDADARPDPGFLEGLRSALRPEVEVVQAVNLVEAAEEAPLALVRRLAFHLKCELRPIAFEKLGCSVGLHGNGMCFRREVLRRYRWNERSVVEDAEMHLRLVADGVRVRFAPGAVLRSDMPRRFRGAAGQAVRWERGKFDLLGPGARLVLSGLVTARVAPLAAGYDALVPPLSFLVAAGLLSALLGAVTDRGLAAIGALALLGLGGYVARGIVLAGMGPRAVLRIGMWAPAYIAWKIAILARAAAGAGRGTWAQARLTSSVVVPTETWAGDG